MRGVKGLQGKISRATGSDARLDHAIRDTLDPAASRDSVPPYTASVDACLVLIGTTLPKWHWHVGHGPDGVLPYASLTCEEADPVIRVEATAPTVPLALLGALVKAAQSDPSAANKA